MKFEAEQFTFDNPPAKAVLDTEIKLPIALDYETYYSKKLKYTILGNIPEAYAESDLFHPYILAVSDGRHSWSGAPKDLNWDAIDDHVLLSHNARFERAIYAEQVKRKQVPQIRFPAWHCTANLTSYLCNRRALDNAVEVLYKVKLDKSARSDADGKHWPEDFPEAEQKKMLEYAKGDVHWCQKLWADYSPKWPEDERFLSNLTIEQGIRGVQIDVPLLKEYICLTHEMLRNTEKLIPWIKDAEDEEWREFDTKPTATKCIAEQCRRLGIACPPVKSKDEEAYEEWEDTYGPKYPWVMAVGDWRSVNKLYKTFVLVKERLRPDGTLPFSLKYFGAHTGRWAGDARVNFQNMRKVPAFRNELGLLEHRPSRIVEAVETHEETGKWPEWVGAAIDFRALVIPRAGKKMIVSDLSQIEPRVLAWLSGNHKLLDMIREGYGVYEAFARANMSYTGPKMDKKSSFYKMIKIQVLGLGYGCGWNKFIKIASQGGEDIVKDDPEWTEEEDVFTGEKRKVSGYGQHSREIVNNFRKNSPLTVALWNRLDEGVRRSMGCEFKMNLPNGRTMTYSDVRQVIRMRVDPLTKRPRKTWEIAADSDGRHKPVYGGKLTENLVQAVARDVFAAQIVRMEKRGWSNLFSVHDEAVLEVDQDVTAKQVEEEMSFCPDWIKGLPVAAEANEVSHYQK
jgi:hypothetical protein